jgi:hypothetical protein
MFDSDTEKKVILTDKINENNARGGGDVHGATARAEVTIEADVVIVADNVAEVLDMVDSAEDHTHAHGERGSADQ